MENTAQHSNVELVLIGIDKVWVRAKNGQWRDKKELVQSDLAETDPQTESIAKKWWQFWK